MNPLLRVAPWVALAFSFWMVERKAAHLTQKPPGAAVLQVLSNIRVTRSLAFVFGIAGLFYGLQLRNLRRRSEAAHRERIRQLEAISQAGQQETDFGAAQQ